MNSVLPSVRSCRTAANLLVETDARKHSIPRSRSRSFRLRTHGRPGQYSPAPALQLSGPRRSGPSGRS